MSVGKFLAIISICLWAVWSEGVTDPLNVPEDQIESWADTTFEGLVSAGRISGAVVSVVKDGRILLEKGYGLGDVVAGTAADPYLTRARIGSTTKTFTATIIAQLTAEGKIASLHDPANTYLARYKLPENRGVPITLKHLLTHTAGFEDKFFFISSDRPVSVPVEAELYDQLRPAFVRPAGEKVVYSNFGVATLGLVIEDIMGLSINKAMQARIFGPLGMASTDLVVTIDEPEGVAVPGRISAQGITGRTPFAAINPAVAQTGAIVSTAHDMALYMMAHMEGWPGYGRDLQDRLFTRLAGNHPDIGGVGMVFFVDEWAGRKTVSHGGNWAGFHTWMTMVPEERLGFYVTLFSDAVPTGVVERFLSAVAPSQGVPPSPAMLSASSLHTAFLQHFLGDKRPMLSVVEEPLKNYEGIYRSDRRPFHSVEALSAVVYFGADILRVTSKEDGLYIRGNGPFKPVGAGRFMMDAPGRPMMTFARNERTGELTLNHDLGIYTFTKIPPYAHSKWHAVALHLVLPLAALGMLCPLVFRRQNAAWPSFSMGVSAFVMVLAATVGLDEGQSLMTGYYAGYTGRLAVFVTAFHGLLISTIGAAFFVLKAKSRASRLAIGVLTAVGAVSVVLLLPYNVLGWRII
ncbi:serine hydrolase domain-containing protein [Luteithermobacter gelatinilyticus]|uniref:serine hydrolase domain-containing protein n=1 Tax=Luteithermobacter gelatinilyticus TaxID=2582913 RepID=UPI00143D0601|nr:serine hydrolase domain-containing protein [Luteithermobacter gelatinilyticus]